MLEDAAPVPDAPSRGPAAAPSLSLCLVLEKRSMLFLNRVALVHLRATISLTSIFGVTRARFCSEWHRNP
jgi:hypothetical protein